MNTNATMSLCVWLRNNNMEIGPKFKFMKRVDAIGMDPVEVRAIQFAYDPVQYLQSIYIDKQDSGHDTQNALFKVIDEFESVVLAVETQTDNQNLKTFLSTEDPYVQKKAFVRLLKDVGIEENHFLTWANITTDGISDEESLEEGSYRVAIKEVYGEE